MPYYPPDHPLPPGTATPRLLLEPLKPEHVEIDYAAVIESRDQLRLWEGDSWPEDDFTVADNLKDLQYHWREHQQRVAFTYTVLDPTRTLCLGCVYMRPLAELVAYNTTELDGVAADETLVRFWIRTSRLDSGLERHLLETLIQWLHDEWPFPRALFETREVNRPQVQLFESFPLQQVMSLKMQNRGGTH